MKCLIAFCLLAGSLIAGCKSSTEVQPQSQPTVLDFSPKESMIGEIITIYGKDLPTDITQLHIFLDSVGVELLTLTTDSIQVRIPDDAISGKFKIKFNSTLLTTDSFTVKDGVYFYPTRAHVGDIITLHSRPYPTGTYIANTDKLPGTSIKAEKISPGTLQFKAPEGTPTMPLGVETSKGTIWAKDSLEIIPNNGLVRSIGITLTQLRTNYLHLDHSLPFGQTTDSTYKWDTTQVTYSFSNWFGDCSAAFPSFAFCENKIEGDGNGLTILGTGELDTINHIIKSLTYVKASRIHPDPHNTTQTEDSLTFENLPYTQNGSKIEAVINGPTAATYLKSWHTSDQKTFQSLSGGGYVKAVYLSDFETIPETEIRISIELQ